MAFPVSSLLDDFNRANETPIASPWLGPFLTSNAIGNLSGNAFTGTAPAIGEAYLPDDVGPDCEAFAQVLGDIDSGSPEIILRLTNPGTPSAAWYGAYVDLAHYYILKGGGGTQVTIKSGAGVFTSGDWIGLNATGNTLTLWHSTDGLVWTQVDTVIDNTIAGAGKLGMRVYDDTASIGSFGGGALEVLPTRFVTLALPARSHTLTLPPRSRVIILEDR